MKPWWNKKYGKDSICAITRTRLRSGKNKKNEKYSVFLPCKHGFVRSALFEMIKTDIDRNAIEHNCPLCRQTFDPIIIFS